MLEEVIEYKLFLFHPSEAQKHQLIYTDDPLEQIIIFAMIFFMFYFKTARNYNEFRCN